jgi:2-oxoglutarate dehydrogenase E1 component
METLALSQTRGYKTGGTVHIVVNNQIGFTTSDTRDARSSLYCTDIREDGRGARLPRERRRPEAVVMVARIALDYRATFHKDVVIDLVCFRRLGHNEQDEPSSRSRSCTRRSPPAPRHPQALRGQAGEGRRDTRRPG